MNKSMRKLKFILKPGSILIIIPIIILFLILSQTIGAGAIKKTDKGFLPEQESVMTVKPVIVEAQEESVVIPVAVVNPIPITEIKQIETDPEPESGPEPEIVERYAEIEITEAELHELAEMIYHEARGESAEGQQAVAEVVLNRVIAKNFPATVHGVLYQGKGTKAPQFTPINKLGTKTPNKEQYAAIDAALYGPTILPEDVVFFSMQGENKNRWGKIGCHIFCYQYDWK